MGSRAACWSVCWSAKTFPPLLLFSYLISHYISDTFPLSCSYFLFEIWMALPLSRYLGTMLMAGWCELDEQMDTGKGSWTRRFLVAVLGVCITGFTPQVRGWTRHRGHIFSRIGVSRTDTPMHTILLPLKDQGVHQRGQCGSWGAPLSTCALLPFPSAFSHILPGSQVLFAAPHSCIGFSGGNKFIHNRHLCSQ